MTLRDATPADFPAILTLNEAFVSVLSPLDDARLARLHGQAALHRVIYVIVVLGTIHFWMSVKRDITDPLIYAAVFAFLLGYRIVRARRKAGERAGKREAGTGKRELGSEGIAPSPSPR